MEFRVSILRSFVNKEESIKREACIFVKMKWGKEIEPKDVIVPAVVLERLQKVPTIR